MQQVWCALLVIVQYLSLHQRKDDLGQDGFKQCNFVGGNNRRLRLESNLGLYGFVHSFWHPLSCMYIPAHSLPFHLLHQDFFQVLLETVAP